GVALDCYGLLDAPHYGVGLGRVRGIDLGLDVDDDDGLAVSADADAPIAVLDPQAGGAAGLYALAERATVQFHVLTPGGRPQPRSQVGEAQTEPRRRVDLEAAHGLPLVRPTVEARPPAPAPVAAPGAVHAPGHRPEGREQERTQHRQAD